MWKFSGWEFSFHRKLYLFLNLIDFGRPAFRDCVAYTSDFNQVLIFSKFHLVKKSFYLKEVNISYIYGTIKFKHSCKKPSLCVLYFTEIQGIFAPVRNSGFGIRLRYLMFTVFPDLNDFDI